MKNIVNYLINNNEEKNNSLIEKCYDILLNVISSKHEILSELSTKQAINDIITRNLSSKDKLSFIIQSVKDAVTNKNNEYIYFMYDITNNLLNEIKNDIEKKELRQLYNELNKYISEINKNISDDNKINDILNSIKIGNFDKRLQGIKTINDYINKSQSNKQNIQKIVELIIKNGIINEIFGPNYHSQIISKSIEILKTLVIEDKLNEDDIKLIWSCTKRGDIEAKLTIMNLLSDLAPNLKENSIAILLDNIINSVDSNQVNQNEIDLVYKLSIQGNDNEESKLRCCDYLYRCLLTFNDVEINKTHNIILDKLLILLDNDEKCISKVLNFCEKNLNDNHKTLFNYSILFHIIKKYLVENNSIQKEPIKYFITNDDHLLNLFKKNFYDYISKAKKETEGKNAKDIDNYIIDSYTHKQNFQKRMEYFTFLINNFYTKFDFLPFVKDILINNFVSPNDQLIFYDFIKNYILNTSNNENKNKIREQIFKIFTEINQSNINSSQFHLFITLFLEMNQNQIKYITIKEKNE